MKYYELGDGMQLCLNCARLESRRDKLECPVCQGTLWLPRNVGGVSGNTDLNAAVRLVQAGKKPWSRA